VACKVGLPDVEFLNGEDATEATQPQNVVKSEVRITYGVSSIARYDFSVLRAFLLKLYSLLWDSEGSITTLCKALSNTAVAA
jgi:hypothetical protein